MRRQLISSCRWRMAPWPSTLGGRVSSRTRLGWPSCNSAASSIVITRSPWGMLRERMFSMVVLPEPVLPEIRIVSRARAADSSTIIISAVALFNSTRLLLRTGPRPKRRMDIEGPSMASGGMMAFTRDPSGRRASTIGDDSSTRRPTRDTMRSIICNRCASSRNRAAVLCSRPIRSTKMVSRPLIRMSEMVASLSRGSSGPNPKISSSRSAWIFDCSSKLSGTPWPRMISSMSPATTLRAC